MKKQKDVNISFRKHRTAKSIVYEYFILNNKAPLNTKVYLESFTVKKTIGEVKEAIQIVKKLKYWGFYQKKNKTIHYWYDDNCQTSNLFILFGHELTHSIGISNEELAMKVGLICKFSYQMIKRFIKQKLEKDVCHILKKN